MLLPLARLTGHNSCKFIGFVYNLHAHTFQVILSILIEFVYKFVTYLHVLSIMCGTFGFVS